MNVEERIEQFRNMADADPDNELGHFSLGKAYVEAGQCEAAIEPLRRALDLNPTLSRAYQLLGKVLLEVGRRDDAVAVLLRGFEVSAGRGDLMVRDEIGQMLGDLGVEVPKTEQAAAGVEEQAAMEQGASSSGFRCARCGRPNGQMEERPFKGNLGERIWAEVCQSCWQEWIRMGTKVINEMGLELADERHQATYDEYMMEFLQLER